MKKKYLQIGLVCLFFITTSFQCDDRTNCEIETELLTTEDIPIKINRTSNLAINDTIWISLTINKQLKDSEGNTLNIELNDMYGNQNYISTEIKNNFDEYSSLNFGTFFIEEIGEVDTQNGAIIASLDSTINSYSYNFGLILKERGSYKFTTGNLYYTDYSNDNNCPKYSYNLPLYFEDGITSNNQNYIFTVD